MATRRKVSLVARDFQGGINLRSDAFQLRDNEAQLALNVELDARGGFRSRRGWTRIHDDPELDGDVFPSWDPRGIYAQVFGANEYLLVPNRASYSNGGGPLQGSIAVVAADGSHELLEAGSDPIVCSASPHLADFAQWANVVYIACGKDERGAKWTGSGAASLGAAAGPGTWVDDYTAPTGFTLPQADCYAAHMGYLFAGCTKENSVDYPHRVRWSHPNNPENWASLDFRDIVQGGSRITGLVPFGDHLVIFKTDSVWRLDGYDRDSWSLAPISLRVGAIHRQAIAVAENRIYFLSYPHGVYMLDAESGLYEVSEQLRPGIHSPGFNGLALDNIWLSYAQQRLWVSVPFSQTSTPQDAVTTLVFDPTLDGGHGGWTAYRAATGGTVGALVEAMLSDRIIGVLRGETPGILQLEATDEAVDLVGEAPEPFEAYLVTRWFNGGEPTRRKSWKSAQFIVKDSLFEQRFNVKVYTDYDEASPKRQWDFVIPQRASGFIWGDFTWGDGSLWGLPPDGSRIQRGSSIGLGTAVQLKVTGPPGVAWGVDAIVFIYVPKNLR